MSQHQDDGSVRPVGCTSRSFQQHEKNYSITELVGLAILWEVKHIRHYLYGHSMKCILTTRR